MTLESQYREFLRNNRGGFCSFEEWKKMDARLVKQALVNIMKDDEELGLYEQIAQDNPVLKGSTTLVKKETKELNYHIALFLLKNGFLKKAEGSIYTNPKCTVIVLDACYKINYDHPEYGEVTTYTDSWSIPHLVGTLTWNDLIDRNYIK